MTHLTEKLNALHANAATDADTYAKLEVVMADLELLGKSEVAGIAKEFGIRRTFATKRDTMRAIERKVAERRGRNDRSELITRALVLS